MFPVAAICLLQQYTKGSLINLPATEREGNIIQQKFQSLPVECCPKFRDSSAFTLLCTDAEAKCHGNDVCEKI